MLIYGIFPRAAFLHQLCGRDVRFDTTVLVNRFDYRISFAGLGLSGEVDYTERNLIEKQFRTFKMHIDRFFNWWVVGATVDCVSSKVT